MPLDPTCTYPCYRTTFLLPPSLPLCPLPIASLGLAYTMVIGTMLTHNRGTQTNPAIWSTIEPSIGIVSACLPIMGPVLRSRTITEIRSTSWFTPSKSSGTDHHHHHHHRDAGSAFHKNMQIPEKPAVAYSPTWRQGSVDDVAMGCANGDVELGSKR